MPKGEWTVVDHGNQGNSRTFQSRDAAERAMETVEDLGGDPELIPPGEATEASEETQDETEPATPVVEDAGDPQSLVEDVPEETQERLAQRSVADDPLDMLPSYMIDRIEGKPALNKRGLCVLAFMYDVTVIEREYVKLPTDTEWEAAIVSTTVENEHGNRFVGTGTAHVDRGDEKGVLLELAETRSYKRAVTLATGTGIVAYQELTSEVQE